MKARNIIATLALLPLGMGLTGCQSDAETEARPAKEILIVEGGDIVLRASEENKNVVVNADCAWTVSLDAGDFGSRLSVQPLKGNGNGTLVITSDQNTTMSDRKATITLTSDGGLRQKITLTQTSSDPGMTVTRHDYHFQAVPTQSQLLTITSNTNWNIQMPTGVDWLHLSQTSGNAGSTAIDISVDEIQTDADRSATFTIHYGSNSTEIEVSQTGKTNIELAVSPAELPYFLSAGGTQTIQVTSNAAWRAFVPSSAQSWLRVEPTEGVGNGEVTVTVSENANPRLERISLVIIIAGSQSPKQGDVLIQQYAADEPDQGQLPGEGDNPNPNLMPKRPSLYR